MSYSRWSSSYWYTFWSASGGDGLDDAEFEICSILTFTSKELRDDMDACLIEVAKHEKMDFMDPRIDELRGYMQEFLNDIRKYYKPKIGDSDGKTT